MFYSINTKRKIRFVFNCILQCYFYSIAYVFSPLGEVYYLVSFKLTFTCIIFLFYSPVWPFFFLNVQIKHNNICFSKSSSIGTKICFSRQHETFLQAQTSCALWHRVRFIHWVMLFLPKSGIVLHNVNQPDEKTTSRNWRCMFNKIVDINHFTAYVVL